MRIPQLIVTDLDDTLLRGDKTVSAFTLQTLRDCRARGIKLVFATGRGGSAKRLLPAELFDGAVYYNGAWGFAGEELVYTRSVPPESALPFLREMTRLGILAAAEVDGVHCANFDPHAHAQWGTQSRWIPLDLSPGGTLPNGAQKLYAVTENAAQAEAVRRAMPKDLHCYIARDGLAMVMHREATKENALRALARHWGIDMADVWAFGDDENDLPLLKAAGTAIAMQNALPQVKAAAQYVCESNEADGVARFLMQNCTMAQQAYSRVLDALKKEYTTLLGGNLVGIYLHGSIAFQCFNWAKSDIDYIIVVEEPLTLREKRTLMELTVALNEKAPKKGLEMSVVQKKYCQKFVYPTPFALHFSNDHLQRWREDPMAYLQNMQPVDADLAAHFTVIKHRGLVLCGEPIHEVFSGVEEAHYLDSIQADIADARELVCEYPVYFVLNLCRVLAYREEGAVLSKREGGQWGIANLPAEYYPLLQRMLDNYAAAEDDEMPLDSDLALSFSELVLGKLENAAREGEI